MSFQIRTRADSADKHTADVNTLIYYKGKLYSGADDGKIMSWEEDLRKITEVKAHVTTVLCLAGSSDNLFSCSNDGNIKKWSLTDLQEQGTLFTQKDGEIYRLVATNGTLYSSDEQGVVRVHEGDVIKNIFNLLEPLREVIVLGNFLYTVRDLDLVITEMKDNGNFQTAKSFNGRAPACLAGDYLCFSSRGGKDIIIHENNPENEFKPVAEVKDAHTMIINSLVGVKTSSGAVLYSAGWDKIIKKWKIENGACTLVGSVDSEMVVNVLTNGEKGEIYAGGSDGHIIRVDDM
ncbi:E3 ubiquitin-protein ligase TRAF7 [Onthophagus taurus]|uniref:E3 ubiquitin-protein ligase TRAF7 n=1 Tax=Onthophagus taurus TaxID=166361 RepID=UPI0039BDAC6F